MPRIRVKLFANLREYARTKELWLEGETVRDVLKSLSATFPGMENMIFDAEKVRPYINILVNGRNIHDSSGLDTRLNRDDELAVFPPVSGGG